MRKTCYALLLIALIAPSITSLSVSRADSTVAPGTAVSPWQSTILGLPDFDIRHELAALQTPSSSKSSADRASMQSRVEAIESFRTAFPPESRDNLRYEMNAADLPKVFFNLSAPLSKSSNDAHDQIARRFLNEHQEVFGLSSRDVAELKLESEDNDQGITFMHYRQIIGGVEVFEGQVQVAIGAAGEVLSVMEGMLSLDSALSTTPTLSEAAGLAEAFKFCGREATTSSV